MEYFLHTRYTVLVRMSNFTFQLLSGLEQTCQLISTSIVLQLSLNDLLSHESDAKLFPLSDGGLGK